MQTRTLTAAAALVLFATTTLTAQEAKAATVADASMAMPKPGPEHENLKKAEGTWDVVVEGMGMPTTKGKAQMKMTMNGFFMSERFTCDMGDNKFEGHGTTGFDPNKGKYVSTWFDNSSPALLMTEGTFDPKTKTLTMVGDGYDHAGQKVKMRNLTIHKDANNVVFEMYHTGKDSKEMKVMTITYTRQQMPAKPAK